MARIHVRLLGPCFKTGRRGRRPTRQRDANRKNEFARYTSPLTYPSGAKPESGCLLFRGRRSRDLWSAPNGSCRKLRRKCVREAPTDAETSRWSDLGPDAGGVTEVESPSETSRTPPFTTTQFHVLLNSLFKVLFNLPSRYLFAIGLGVIFSLTRSLPRALGCTPKQPDSREKSARRDSRLTGLSPSTGHGHCQVGL